MYIDYLITESEVVTGNYTSRSEVTNRVVFGLITWFASPGESSQEFVYMYMYIYIYIYDVVKSKRRHWLAVTLSFTPCGDRQTDFYYNEEISLALYTVYLC